MPNTTTGRLGGNITEEAILNRYESLPEDVKQAMMGISTADAIYSIGKKADLNVEKIGALAEEVGLIILGFVPSTNFVSDIKKNLEVDEEKASAVAQEINDRVFLPIRESLKKIHGAAWVDNITKLPVRVGSQKISEVKPAPPQTAAETKGVPEVKPVAKEIAPVEQKVSEKKEPLVIRPMGVPLTRADETPKEDMRFYPSPSVLPAAKPTSPPQTQIKEREAIGIPPPSLPVRPYEQTGPQTKQAVTTPSISDMKSAEKKPPPMPPIPPPPIRPPTTPPAAARETRPQFSQKIFLPPPTADGPTQKPAEKLHVPPPAPRTGGFDPYKEPIE